MQEIAGGVGVLPVTIANTYFIGARGDAWCLVDTGTSGGLGKILGAAEARYGHGARPQAILLTHGHPDHSGNAAALSDFWNVPIYAHRLELPFIQGKSKYPPSDPTVGGAMAMLTRAFPSTLNDLGSRVEAFPEGGVIPGLPGWEWLPTPGHSPGHVSFFRAGDRTLLAGDALTTINLDSLVKMVRGRPEIAPPPPPITCDWGAARASVERLAALAPLALGCGHGVPLTGPSLAGDLRRFADTFTPPAHGRYVHSPAVTDENGIVSLPPRAPDLFPIEAAAVIGVAALVSALARRPK